VLSCSWPSVGTGRRIPPPAALPVKPPYIGVDVRTLHHASHRRRSPLHEERHAREHKTRYRARDPLKTETALREPATFNGYASHIVAPRSRPAGCLWCRAPRCPTREVSRFQEAGMDRNGVTFGLNATMQRCCLCKTGRSEMQSPAVAPDRDLDSGDTGTVISSRTFARCNPKVLGRRPRAGGFLLGCIKRSPARWHTGPRDGASATFAKEEDPSTYPRSQSRRGQDRSCVC
jgi:hypothetical protein